MFKKNIGNIISIIGTIATLIFGIYGLFFVPDYVNDAKKEKQTLANKEIINDIKEIIYSNAKSDSHIVSTLKNGKELKYDITLQKTNKQILVETQEDFINDKFLPFKQRMALYSKIDSLKAITPNDDNFEEKKIENKVSENLIIYTLSIMSLLVSLLLIFKLFFRRKQQINDELEKLFEKIQDINPEISNEFKSFEIIVAQTLSELGLDFEDFTINPKDFAFDFLIKLKDKRIGIEIKSKLRLDTLNEIKEQYDNSKLNALVIITNQILDFSTFNSLFDLTHQKKLTGRKIHLITTNNIDKLKKELIEILKLEKE